MMRRHLKHPWVVWGSVASAAALYAIESFTSLPVVECIALLLPGVLLAGWLITKLI